MSAINTDALESDLYSLTFGGCSDEISCAVADPVFTKFYNSHSGNGTQEGGSAGSDLSPLIFG